MRQQIQKYLRGVWYSMPIQLLMLHLKRYQVLLIFWAILFATVNGSFLYKFGAHILFLYPEYLGEVNALSTALVGAGVGVFVMCWNITTFILYSRHFKFLAATTQPFLKYCINNSIIPLAFLVFYLINAIVFIRTQELQRLVEILGLVSGFVFGFIFVIALSFSYFFGADRTIYRFMHPTTKAQLEIDKHWIAIPQKKQHTSNTRVDWYLSATFKVRQPRHVEHYTQEFVDRIFSQHHLAAIFSVMIVFGLLIIIGYLQDYAYLQLPAGGSITVFFAILIAIAGSISHFLRSWALPFVLVIFLLLNTLYHQGILDPRNKAYGIDYTDNTLRPDYSSDALKEVANTAEIRADSAAFIKMLNNWKLRQAEEKPVFVVVSVSGGGSRAATFSMQVLRQLDSMLSEKLTPATFLMTGASGGMMGAAWFRELYIRQQQGKINDRLSAHYIDDISRDILNPIFSSFVSRDLLAPAQYFQYEGHKYVKDRGYAFEQRLNENTHGWLDRTLDSYAAIEATAAAPRLLINAVANRDGRKVMISSHPVRFLMRPFGASTASNMQSDAIDFVSYFKDLEPGHLRMLSALRMNASFPYILPGVWLPTRPVIDVMDAGFRDNTGLETAIRFIAYFKNWLLANCSRVVVLQMRDKPEGGWENPYESESILDLVTRPALLTQNNLFRFQEYDQFRQWEMLSQMMGDTLQRIVFEYKPFSEKVAASMSFHLTQREKKDLRQSLQSEHNRKSFQLAMQTLASDSGYNQSQGVGLNLK